MELDGLLATRYQDPVVCYNSTRTSSLPCGELGLHQGMKECTPYAISPGFERQSDRDDEYGYGVVEYSQS